MSNDFMEEFSMAQGNASSGSGDCIEYNDCGETDDGAKVALHSLISVDSELTIDYLTRTIFGARSAVPERILKSSVVGDLGRPKKRLDLYHIAVTLRCESC